MIYFWQTLCVRTCSPAREDREIGFFLLALSASPPFPMRSPFAPFPDCNNAYTTRTYKETMTAPDLNYKSVFQILEGNCGGQPDSPMQLCRKSNCQWLLKCDVRFWCDLICFGLPLQPSAPYISCSHQSSFYSSVTYPVFCDGAILHSSCQWLISTTHPENLPWLQILGLASSMCQKNGTIGELATINLCRAAVFKARVLTEMACEWQLSLKCEWRDGNIAFRLSRFRFWAQAAPPLKFCTRFSARSRPVQAIWKKFKLLECRLYSHASHQSIFLIRFE